MLVVLGYLVVVFDDGSSVSCYLGYLLRCLLIIYCCVVILLLFTLFVIVGLQFNSVVFVTPLLCDWFYVIFILWLLFSCLNLCFLFVLFVGLICLSCWGLLFVYVLRCFVCLIVFVVYLFNA